MCESATSYQVPRPQEPQGSREGVGSSLPLALAPAGQRSAVPCRWFCAEEEETATFRTQPPCSPSWQEAADSSSLIKTTLIPPARASCERLQTQAGTGSSGRFVALSSSPQDTAAAVSTSRPGSWSCTHWSEHTAAHLRLSGW